MKYVDKDRAISTSFAKGLAVLEAFDARAPHLSMAEIARRTGQDRATARRGTLTLEALGYLERKGRLFALSPKLLAMSGRFLQAKQILPHAQPILERCANELKCPVYLATYWDASVLILAKSASANSRYEVGMMIDPLHSALGHILLASLAEESLDDVLSNCLNDTTNTNDKDAVFHQLDQVRDQGFASVQASDQPTSCAVPVSGEAMLALSADLTNPTPTSAEVDLPVPTLQNCASALARLPSIRDF